jgi:hypothetical protein
MGQPRLVVELWAGLARISLIQGDCIDALVYVDEIWRYLADHPASGDLVDPLLAYLTCYRVLRASEDPRTEEMLAIAHRLLQGRADKISDENMRRAYLENVPYHRAIAAEWECLAASGPAAREGP